MSSAKSVRPPAVVIDGVSKRFRLHRERPASLKEKVTKLKFERRDEFWALDDVSFAVPAGSMFGFIGHNGSGKSTLLRIITGIYKPTIGRVTTHGRISALLELGAGFHPDLTGRENVYLNAAILGMTRKETERMYGSIVEFSGLEDFIDTPVRHYSSGMYVRLGFSVAVHVQPDILMVDEVIAVGDTEFQRRCHEHFYKLRSQGTTIVIVTHGLEDVKASCDEVAWLDHGHLRAVGPASDIVRQYWDVVNLAEAERHGREGADLDHGTFDADAVAIEKVSVLAADGRPLPLLSSHDPAVIQVEYTMKRPIADARVGFNISNSQDLVLAGTSADQVLALPPTVGSGKVRFTVPSIPFGPGDYHVSVAITDPDGLITYDLADRATTLRVRPGAIEVAGLVRLEGSWERAALELEQPL